MKYKIYKNTGIEKFLFEPSDQFLPPLKSVILRTDHLDILGPVAN